MNNYDEYLIQGQYTKDETGDKPYEVWMVLDEDKEEIFSSGDYEEVQEFWNGKYAKGYGYFGYILNTDIGMDFWRYFTVVEEIHE
jgi:hypothetical protein